MPKFTLLLGRQTMQVYDFEQASVKVGREEGVDIVIDNASVSRRHAEFRHDGSQWVVQDLGSSNGTFLNGTRVEGAQAIKQGDEIGIGKFSVVFDKVVGEASQAASAASGAGPSTPTMPDTRGTMQIKAHEVEELLATSSKKRAAQLQWESGGQRGTHYMSDQAAVLIGTDILCDVKVPKGPKHHLLIIQTDKGAEARNLAAWGKMTVGGSATKRARLKDGDVVEMGGAKVTYVGELS